MNSFNGTGNLGKDPEMKYFESGKVKTTFSIALDGNGETPLWVEIQTWEKQAEIAGEYLKKGHKVGVTGRLAKDTWEQDGQIKSKIYVNASRLTLLKAKEQ